MENYICKGCGTSYTASVCPPELCQVCNEERAHVPGGQQEWTTLRDMQRKYRNSWKMLEQDMFEITTVPRFSIGQRAILIRTPAGNILWDCISFLDNATKHLIDSLGGISAIAISHPHYYTTSQDWASSFGCQVYLHADDKEWLMRPDSSIRFWEGDYVELNKYVSLVRLGGHYHGGTVAHLPFAAEGRGAVLSGDIIQVAADRCRVSFMWSYPNMLPLSERTVSRMTETVLKYRFDRLYGALSGHDVLSGAGKIIRTSADRYIDLLNDRTGTELPATE
ncbi:MULTISPECIES: MBL fold metallo-hydrolase [Erwinia]|uniref:MBL fold metallo-hydrolase n=1 Tax=Erwinia rhapontici TaxID=55212 RepID=A0ABN6DRN0_ERWRD|nr:MULTISPECIES: MBL fold metallo-hydrolase [Erwinia]MCS3609701.1 hypothetical protein [Erwinia rhapontici]NNS09691.1 MBL fold metallo-hydrolase [Erwinia sp. JH02]BCQ37375.1 MBL fold metallo-hydrolase [Erwinia rhapontici]